MEPFLFSLTDRVKESKERFAISNSNKRLSCHHYFKICTNLHKMNKNIIIDKRVNITIEVFRLTTSESIFMVDDVLDGRIKLFWFGISNVV